MWHSKCRRIPRAICCWWLDFLKWQITVGDILNKIEHAFNLCGRYTPAKVAVYWNYAKNILSWLSNKIGQKAQVIIDWFFISMDITWVPWRVQGTQDKLSSCGIGPHILGILISGPAPKWWQGSPIIVTINMPPETSKCQCWEPLCGYGELIKGLRGNVMVGLVVQNAHSGSGGGMSGAGEDISGYCVTWEFSRRRAQG